MNQGIRLKMQQENLKKLELQLFPKACAKVLYTEDELSALFYWTSNQSIPDALMEKILSVKKRELSLYELLFDVTIVEGITEFGMPTGTKFYCFKPARPRCYLKLNKNQLKNELNRLSELQEKFLNSWGLSYEDSENVSVEMFMKMKEQLVNFQGYITLDEVECFIGKEGEEKTMIRERELEANFKLAVEIFDKLMEANIVKGYDELEEQSGRFVYSEFLNKFKFLPVENLKKIVEMEYKNDITVAKWFQELQKQQLLNFVPYLCEREDGKILIVLNYNEYIIWNTWNGEFTVSFNDIEDGYSVDNKINVTLQNIIKTILQNHIGENIEETKLLQILFYIGIMNLGAHSRAFQDKLLQGTELLDEFVATLSKYANFEQYDFKFNDFLTFMNKEEKRFEALINTDKVDTFRVPAYDAEFDLCRIAIYNSLHMVMEHTSENGGGSGRMNFNLEPLLEQMNWLSKEEKQFILTSKAIRNTIILFLLNVRSIGITQMNVYVKKGFATLPKLNRELPVICGLNDLIL